MTGAGTAGRPSRTRDALRRRRLLVIAVPLAVLVLVAALVVVVGIVAKPAAERYVAERVEESLPEGVTADVSAELGGSFLVLQYLSGRMEEVRLWSDELLVADVPLAARMRLERVPVDLAQPVGHVTGSVDFDDRAVQGMLAGQGFTGDIVLTDGKVQYADDATILGARIGYTVTVEPVFSGGLLSLVPKSAEVRTGFIDLDASRLLDLVAPDPLTVCLAEYLPASLRIDDLELRDDTARLSFSGDDVVFTEEALDPKGSCT